jgi:tRNA A22 N-methylase
VNGQRSFESLRAFLSGTGFSIEKESICIDRDKFYTILLVKWTGQKPVQLSLTERVLGPCLLKTRPENFIKYLQHQKNVLKKHMRARPELAAVLTDIEMILNENPAAD